MKKLTELWRQLVVKNPQVSLTVVGILYALYLIFPDSAVTFILFLFSFLVLFRTFINDKYKILAAAIGLCVIMPIAGMQNTYYLDVATQVGIYAALALGLNIVVGFSGLLNLGYVAFYAAGAYLYAIFATSQANNFISFIHFPLSGMWFWPFLVFSIVFSGLLGLLLGFPVLRLRGDYLAIVTLGFAEIIRIILNNLDKPINFTNGPKGLSPVQPPELFGYVLNQPVHFYFIVLIIVVIAIIISKRLDASRIGRAWASIREDEIAAASVGVPVVKMKLLAFAFGAAFAGMMGVIFSAKQTFIDPSSFGFMESIGILAMVILGGMGSISGAVIGAVIVVVLQLQLLKDLSEFLRQVSMSGIVHIPAQFDPAKYERLIFGVILICMCIFRPQGILPSVRKIIKRAHPDHLLRKK